MKKRWGSVFLAAILLVGSACSTKDNANETPTNSAETASAETTAEASATAVETDAETTAEPTSQISSLSTGEINTTLPQIDMAQWQYEESSDIYYQIGIVYCANQADANYEQMGVFVPGAYFNATENADGTYTCAINAEAKVGDENYTASTAPIVIPVNTPGYSAQDPPTQYTSEVENYCSEGFVYVYPGCRGRDQGAPLGVTDLKAAIRYIRYNDGMIPGNMEQIYSFGMSGGGAQSSVLGASGDSALYDDYLEAIGAVTGVSDAVTGAMAWCPITNLDQGDAAYEWNMGSTRSDLGNDDQTVSNYLATTYGAYINQIGLKDAQGNALLLEESDSGIYQAGTYYDYLLGVIETSLNHFLSDTTFPYDSSSNSGGPGGGGQRPDRAATGGNETTTQDGPTDETDAANTQNSEIDFTQMDNITRNSSSATAAVTLTGTYETAQDYIDALNAPYTWVEYDATSNTATITSVEDFTKALKVASKDIGAFDQLDRGQGENTLFGYGDGNGAHFDAVLSEAIVGTGYETEYGTDFTEDLAKTDALGHSVSDRLNMYTPLYYLMESYDGYNTSTVAKYWRIRTGINQGDTALSTEVNLALAAEAYSDETEVDFETVWGLGHTMAERTGDSTTNFIQWVNQCVGLSA